MRSISLFLLFIALWASPANAQIHLDVQAGPQFTFLGYDRDRGAFGFHAGASVDWPIAGKIFLRSGAGYSRKGTTLRNFFPGQTIKLEIDYLSAWMLVGYSLADRFQVTLGSVPGFRIGGQVRLGQDKIGGPDNYTDWDFGLQVGVSFRVLDRISLFAGYVHGLVDVVEVRFTDANGQSLGGIFEGRNRTIQAGLAWRIH